MIYVDGAAGGMSMYVTVTCFFPLMIEVHILLSLFYILLIGKMRGHSFARAMVYWQPGLQEGNKSAREGLVSIKAVKICLHQSGEDLGVRAAYLFRALN